MGNGIIGIDIGRSGVRLVQVAVGIQGKYRITAAEQYDFRTEGGAPQALEKILEKIRRDERFRGDTCVTSLPAEFFSFRNIRMPFLEKRKIRQTLNFELEPLLPVAIDEVITDFSVVEQNGGSDILAAAVSREAIAGRLGALEPLRVSVVDIEAVPSAVQLLTGSAPVPGETARSCYILLDIGAAGTTAVFFRRNSIFQVRTFSFGGDAITGAISEILEIDFEQAEQRKRSGIDSVSDRPLADEIARRCDRFCEELDHTLQFLKLRRSDEKPSKIYVTGGGAKCASVAASLQRRFSLPVEPVDIRVMRQVSIPTDALGSWDPLRMDGALALALRGAVKAGGFNFRRDAREVPGAVRFVTDNARRIGAVVAVIFGILAFDSAAGYLVDRNHLANLKAESERILKIADPGVTRVVDPAQQLRTRIAEARKFAVSGAGADVSALDFLKKISEAVPGNARFLISDLNYDGEKIEIRGETSDFDTVETIKRGIAGAGVFRNVSVSGANLVKDKNKVEFELRMTCAR